VTALENLAGNLLAPAAAVQAMAQAIADDLEVTLKDRDPLADLHVVVAIHRLTGRLLGMG
jgi:hypothetical protein